MSRTSGKQAVPELYYEWVPARADSLPQLRHAVARWVEGVGLSSEQAAEIELAVYEALANVVRHAYHSNGTFDLRAEHHPEHGAVEITVVDRGAWQTPSHVQDTNGGRGLLLMRRLADSVDIDAEPTGTTVRFRWRTSPGVGTGPVVSDSFSLS